jgi:hypothetical protein
VNWKSAIDTELFNLGTKERKMPPYSTSENAVHERGTGTWRIMIYKPEEVVCGPYRGVLTISKDFHTIYLADGQRQKCIASIPSQNVAYVEDAEIVDVQKAIFEKQTKAV